MSKPWTVAAGQVTFTLLNGAARESGSSVSPELYTRCEDLIDRLGVPDPFNLDSFVALLKERRSRPIQILQHDFGQGTTCGLWIPLADVDYIYYHSGVSPLHQLHIILHEIGHIAFEHKDGIAITEIARQFTTTTGDALISRMFERAAYNSRDELEAEIFASILMNRAYAARSAEMIVKDPKVADRLHYLWGV